MSAVDLVNSADDLAIFVLLHFLTEHGKYSEYNNTAVVVVFTRFLHGRYTHRVYLTYTCVIGIPRSSSSSSLSCTWGGGLRKPLHGLFARYVSYFKRVNVFLFYCATVYYIHILIKYGERGVIRW